MSRKLVAEHCALMADKQGSGVPYCLKPSVSAFCQSFIDKLEHVGRGALWPPSFKWRLSRRRWQVELFFK
jgi:hypothetical protein